MSTEKAIKSKRFIDRTGVYGLELAVAMITMLIAASVLSFAAYSLFGYVATTSNLSESAGYFALWTASSAIVWGPVAILFYLRTRAEMLAKPVLHDNVIQRTFITIYQVIAILTVISFAVATVFSGLMSLVKPDETSDILLSATAPSAISALLFWLAHSAFLRRGMRRRTFALVFAGVTAVLVVPVIVLSIVSLRSVASDTTAERDLAAIKSAISNYAESKSDTPTSLSQIADNLDSKLQSRLDRYEYSRVNSSRYQLCADFVASSKDDGYDVAVSNPEYGTYTTYPSFSYHGKGRTCFKIQIDNYTSYKFYDAPVEN